jgi:sulfur carrier protein
MIVVNGMPAALCTTISALLSTMDLPSRGIAVAVNGEVVPRASWATSELAEGDNVEVLTAAQGG